MDKENTQLLIKAINEGNASDISSLFDKLMLEKISSLVEERKQEIALTIFEQEELNELSKKTLGSYLKKASHDVATLGAVTRQLSNDSRDARQNDDYTTARKKSAQADSVFQKSWNRRKNMAKVVDRLTKE